MDNYALVSLSVRNMSQYNTSIVASQSVAVTVTQLYDARYTYAHTPSLLPYGTVITNSVVNPRNGSQTEVSFSYETVALHDVWDQFKCYKILRYTKYGRFLI